MRKGGEEKGARGARTAPSVDGIVFIFFCCYVDEFLPLVGFSSV